MLGLGSMILGGVQTLGGLFGLIGLGKKPKYTVSPELQQAYDRSQTMATMGFTPQEEAAYQQNVARNMATQQQRASDLAGGNLAMAMGGMNAANQLASQNQLATADAQLMRQNIQNAQQMALQMQQQKNLATQAAINQRMMTEQSLGGAMQQGLNNLVGGINYNQAMNFYGDQVGGGANNATTFTSGSFSDNQNPLSSFFSQINNQNIPLFTGL